MEKGIVVSCVDPTKRTLESQQMFRAAALPNGFRLLNFGQWNATKRRADDTRGVYPSLQAMRSNREITQKDWIASLLRSSQ